MTTQPKPEIQAFLSRVDALPPGPGATLDAVLQPSLEDEAELRKLFATDRQNARLSDPHVGLVDVFAASENIRKTRARVVQNKDDLSAHYVVPLSPEDRREDGAPCMAADLDEFKRNWSIFTEGSLSQLINWNNVVAAGGSVLACLAPLDEANTASKRAIRKHYHSKAYPTSDVDLFLWGMNAEQAEAKIKAIYEAVRDSVPWDVTCIRTKHTVSIHSQYPYRSVQIVLRLYQSPAEILAGFDIDAPCCAYDGNRVWANPRAIVAMMRQCNTVDVTRRSPSYEIRLIKYSQRAFEIYVPTLRRSEIDPTIFERAIARMEGLARLLVLEKLGSDIMRTAFLAHRRKLRGRPSANTSYARRNARRYKGDLKVESEISIEMNDYDVASLHIPYGPGWDAKKIDKLVYQTDLGMNSTFNPKNKGRRLHRHPAFFGTVEECLGDCCEHCPEPIDEDEKTLQKEEDELYVRGRITFVEENPGRQSITGSFNPIDDGEWSEQVYIKPTQQLFTAIAARDRATVQRLLQDESIDVNQRDYVGRTTLHVAIFSKATDIACDLIDAGARVTARLADGRAPLHLAAQYDLPVIIKKLFERSALNKESEEKKAGQAEKEAEEKAAEAKATADAAKASSEDDWSSHDDEDVVMSEADDEDDDEADKNKSDKGSDKDADGDDDDDDDDDSSDDGEEKKPKPEDEGEIPDEKEDQPDIIEVDAFDWDIGFSAIAYGVLYASTATLDALLLGGADPTVPTKQGNYGQPLHPLALTILRHDEDEACKVAERLLQVDSVTSTTANPQLRTIFHYAVRSGRTKLVETMLRCDTNASTALNFPAVQGSNVVFPIVTALNWAKYPALAVMLAHGARLELVEEDVTKALDVGEPHLRQAASSYGAITNYLYAAHQPLEVVAAAGNDITKLLISLGASIDFGLKRTMNRYSSAHERRTIKDWVHYSISSIDVAIQVANKSYKEKMEKKVKDTSVPKQESMVIVRTGWKGFYDQYADNLQQNFNPLEPTTPETPEQKAEREAKQAQKDAKNHQDNIQRLEDLKAFFLDIETELIEHNAKTWREVHPSITTEARTVCLPPVETKPVQQPPRVEPPKVVEEEKTQYIQLHNSYHRTSVPQHLIKRYDELFEACFAGDNATIQRLCLPVDGQDGIVSSETPLPLDISVKMMDKSTSRYEHYGYTPLFAAIAGRKWSTAKLILAIATAQYAPENKKDAIKFKLSLEDSDDEDDSDAESDDSDMTVEQEEVKFIDIARRPSSVRSQVHPSRMLTEYVRWAKPKTSSPTGPYHGTSNPLDFAVVTDDLDAFVHVANLYATLPDPMDLPSATLALILQHDRPEILDEYIRRTGSGVDLDDAKQGAGGEEDLPSATNDANKLYLGLNVHGKKRMDLARRNDPDADNYEPEKEHPLLWQAIQLKAKGVIDYLHSDRPVLAFKFYAGSHSDPKALWLKRLLASKDAGESALAKKLPLWLGWTTNSVGESPLIVAIISNDIDVVKQVAKLDPQLATKALQSRIKFVGVNPVVLAVRKQCSEKIHDYLLSRKVSPSERTTNDGWNIYHHLCELNLGDLLEYFLKKLPVDVTAPLLIQQSKPRMNTPLHIAVKKGHKRLVQLLLGHEGITPALLLKDIDGQIPLHCAVKCYWTDITSQLLEASPAEALFTEDAVGSTLFDTISVAELTTRLTSFGSLSMHIGEASPSSYDLSTSPMSAFLASERHIEEMLASLETSAGRYKAKIVTAVQKWQASRAERLVVYKQRQAVLDEEERLKEEERKRKEAEQAEKDRRNGAARPNPTDYGNVTKVWELVSEAVKKHAGADAVLPKRHLVHLFEVQQSVAVALSKARGEQAEDDDDDDYSYRRRRSRREREDEGLEPEEEKKEKNERKSSLVFQYLRNGVDTY